MAKDWKKFEGVPAGAVFEATQNALEKLQLTIKKANPSNFDIVATSKKTSKTYGLTINISMSEMAGATTINLETASGQITDWGEGAEVINALQDLVDAEVEKIRSEGRIAAPQAPVYHMSAQPQAPAASPVKEKKGSGNWLGRALFVGAVIWLFVSDTGKDILSNVLGSISVETDISAYDCKKLAGLFEGGDLQNAFGGKFKVISVTDLEEISRTDAMFSCRGTMSLGNGTTQDMTMTIENDGDDQILYKAMPIGL